MYKPNKTEQAILLAAAHLRSKRRTKSHLAKDGRLFLVLQPRKREWYYTLEAKPTKLRIMQLIARSSLGRPQDTPLTSPVAPLHRCPVEWC